MLDFGVAFRFFFFDSKQYLENVSVAFRSVMVVLDMRWGRFLRVVSFAVSGWGLSAVDACGSLFVYKRDSVLVLLL